MESRDSEAPTESTRIVWHLAEFWSTDTITAQSFTLHADWAGSSALKFKIRVHCAETGKQERKGKSETEMDCKREGVTEILKKRGRQR
jgi:hypothetical protein